ncbi:MAG: hypothetical protein PHT07_12955 [Paludibacter sp.]|nr:hypothetical protein [Paludibacter sp.]
MKISLRVPDMALATFARLNVNTSTTNPYLYGGKELERMHGLNVYEFPYRWYDYAVPGFTTPDPLANKHYSESPYSYRGGDPVNRVDPSGFKWYTSNTDPHNVCVGQEQIATLKARGDLDACVALGLAVVLFVIKVQLIIFQLLQQVL